MNANDFLNENELLTKARDLEKILKPVSTNKGVTFIFHKDENGELKSKLNGIMEGHDVLINIALTKVKRDMKERLNVGETLKLGFMFDKRVYLLIIVDSEGNVTHQGKGVYNE